MTAPPPPDPSTSPARPRRPSTILGRLAEAVREQNWFAVVLEVCIVIVGVVIGFQVTSWGQARTDRAREQTYLRQLVADLDETELDIDWTEAGTSEYDSLLARFVHAYHTPEPPPLDSLFHWRRKAGWWRAVRPVTGTADALISTGDLRLIRNDSLRTAIMRYAEYIHDTRQFQANIQAAIRDRTDAMYPGMDRVQVEVSHLSGPERDSLARADPLSFFPAGPLQHRFPLSAEDVLNDRELYANAVALLDAKRDLRGVRAELRYNLKGLRARVQAEIEP